LLSEGDRISSIRLKKKEFFHKNPLRSSESFTPRELAFETLKHLIDRYAQAHIQNPLYDRQCNHLHDD